MQEYSKIKMETLVQLYQECDEKKYKDKIFLEIYKLSCKKIRTFVTNFYRKYKFLMKAEIRQECVIALYKACNAYKDIGSTFNTYSTKCFKNALSSLLGKEMRYRDTTQSKGSIDLEELLYESHENHIDVTIDLQNILDNLTYDDNILYNKRIVEDKTLEQIGKEINLTKQGVNHKLTKIREKISDEYDYKK